MPKPLALPSLRWPLAALENHGRTVALHLHASSFYTDSSQALYTGTSVGGGFFLPCILIHFRVIQGICFFSFDFLHHFRESKPSLLWQTKMPAKLKKQSHSGLPNPKLISRSRVCSISASCAAPLSWKMVCKHLFHEFHGGPFCRPPCCYIKKISL